jgi:hypothetical protein
MKVSRGPVRLTCGWPTSTRPDSSKASLHADLRRRHDKPFFDGLYVGWEDLRRDPAQAAVGPAVHEWRVDLASRLERHLVTWHVLAQAGVAVRGPAVAGLGVHTDWLALAEATRRNLVEYWTPWLRRYACAPAIRRR